MTTEPCGCCSVTADTWAARGPSIFGTMTNNMDRSSAVSASLQRRRDAGESTTPIRGLSHAQEDMIRQFNETGGAARLKSGPQQVAVDMVRLRELRAQGHSLEQCGYMLGVSQTTVWQRLKAKK